MRRHTSRLRTTALAAAVLLLAAGCVTESRKEMKANALDRWGTVRSGVIFSVAQQQFEVGDLDKAERSVLQAIEMKPTEPRYHELAARIELERGNLERSYHILEQALKLAPDSSDIHYLMGVILQRWQRYDAALREYETAYRHRPDEVKGLLAAAEMLVKLGRVDDAVQRLESRMAYFEHNAALRLSLGRIHMLQGHHDKAVMRFREASLLAADEPRIVEHLAMAEYAAEDFPEAIFHLRSLLEREEYADRDDLRVALGDCYMATGKPVEARGVFLELTRRDENDVNAWIKLAQAAWLVGDRVRFHEAARRVLALAPHRHEGYVIRGLIERDAGRIDAAVAQFDHAAQLAPGTALPLILKGLALEQSGDVPGAVEAYRRALEAQPDDPRPRQLLAGLTQ